jgi:hypothetical protein
MLSVVAPIELQKHNHASKSFIMKTENGRISDFNWGGHA